MDRQKDNAAEEGWLKKAQVITGEEMKGSKVLEKLKNHKAVGLLTGILLIAVLLGGLAGVFAILLMFLWNVVVVTALTNAVPITFLTVLKGVGIIYAVLALVNIIYSAIQSYMQTVKMQIAMKIMRQFEDGMKDKQAGALGHFHIN